MSEVAPSKLFVSVCTTEIELREDRSLPELLSLLLLLLLLPLPVFGGSVSGVFLELLVVLNSAHTKVSGARAISTPLLSIEKTLSLFLKNLVAVP